MVTPRWLGGVRLTRDRDDGDRREGGTGGSGVGDSWLNVASRSASSASKLDPPPPPPPDRLSRPAMAAGSRLPCTRVRRFARDPRSTADASPSAPGLPEHCRTDLARCRRHTASHATSQQPPRPNPHRGPRQQLDRVSPIYKTSNLHHANFNFRQRTRFVCGDLRKLGRTRPLFDRLPQLSTSLNALRSCSLRPPPTPHTDVPCARQRLQPHGSCMCGVASGRAMCELSPCGTPTRATS